MKHKTLVLIYLVRGVFLASLVLVILSFKSSFIKTQHLAFSFDQRITAHTVKEIKHTVADLIKQQTTPDQLSHYLIDHWPCIYSVAIAQTLPKTIHVSITARTPWVRINDKKVLTTDSTLVNQSQFITSTFDTLPVIQIPKSMQKERSVCSQLTATISHCYPLLSVYDLVFNSDIQILLYDKSVYAKASDYAKAATDRSSDRKDWRFAIVCTANQLPDAATIERCNRIKEDLAQRGKFSQALARVWLVDTRFTNQLIVSADHGGEIYGANCV